MTTRPRSRKFSQPRYLTGSAVRFPWKRIAVYLLYLVASSVFAQPVQGAGSISDWIQALRSSDYVVYKNAITQLQKEGKAAVPDLIKAFESQDWDLRNGVTEALARIGKPAVPLLIQAAKGGKLAGVEALTALGSDAADAVPVLRELLLENPNKLGQAAATALAVIGKPGVPALVAGLNQTDRQIRIQCANTLGWVGPGAREAVPELLTLLWSDSELQETAARSLRRIRFQSKALEAQIVIKLDSPDPFARKGAVLALSAAEEPSKDAVEKALRIARNDLDSSVRSVALTALAWIAPGNDNVARELVGAMAQEREWGLIGEAANSLVWSEAGNKVVPELIALLDHGTPHTRAMAAHVLGFLGSNARPAIPLLRERLKDPDSSVPSTAAQALGWLGILAREAAPDVAAALATQRINVFIAANTLQRLRSPDPRVIAILITNLNNHLAIEQQRLALRKPLPVASVPMSGIASIVETLGSSGPAAREAIPIITKLSSDHDPLVRKAVISALANISSNATEAVALAVQHLTDKDTAVKVCAADALGLMHEHATNAISALIQGLRDHDFRFRAACTRALGRIGGEDVTPALVQALRDRVAEIRIEGAYALLKLHRETETGWKALTEELNNHWGGPRAEAALKLAELGSEASNAVAPLRKLLEDRLDGVRAAAAQALGRIGSSAAVAIPDLRKACRDPEPNVSKAATLALQRIESAKAPSDK
jgi:HEAT repeat protein